LQAVANTSAEFGAGAAELAVAVVASVCVVALGVAAHDGLALLVPGCTLATGTSKSITAAITIWLGLVFRTVGAGSAASLLGIAFANTGPTHSARGGELTVTAAVFVGVIADSVAPEFARSRVAATVATAACCSTTIALLIAFDDTVATGLTGDGADSPIVSEAAGFDTVAS